MKIRITIPLPEAVIDLLGKDAALEAYRDGENLVIAKLDEDDTDSYLCDGDCRNCPVDTECEYFCPRRGECIYDEEN